MNEILKTVPTSMLQRVGFYNSYFPALSTLSIFIFGLLMIINSHTSVDGGWYFSAIAMQSGIKLYTDLHAPIQPFFPVEVLLFLDLFGKSWLASLMLPITNLCLLVIALNITSKALHYDCVLRSFTIIGSFICIIQFEFYKFDDFHVITDICILYACYLIIKSNNSEGFRYRKIILPLIGIVSGVCFLNRYNDGAVFLSAVLFLVIFPLSKNSINRLMFLSLGLLFSCVIILYLSEDSLISYFNYSIKGVASMKGGASHVFRSPFIIILDMIQQIVLNSHLQITCVTITITCIIAILTYDTKRIYVKNILIHKMLLFCSLVILVSWIILETNDKTSLIDAMLPIVLLVIYLCGAYFISKQIVSPSTWRITSLALLPMGEVISASMSSGGFVGGLFSPMGIFLMIAPTINQRIQHNRFFKLWFCLVCAAIIMSGSIHKVYNPASWNNYKSGVMFENKKIIMHRIYGPMIVNNTTDKFFAGICNKISATKKPSLLSIPFSYENYYCGIRPWDWHIQTFFDTSNAETINAMVKKLGRDPPEWVLYQRQLVQLRGHEIIYNYGKPLPHRALDTFLMEQIKIKKWQVVTEYKESYDSDWLLIRTEVP